MSQLVADSSRSTTLPALTRRDVGLFVLASFVITSLSDVTAQEGPMRLLDGLARQNLFFCFAVAVAGWRIWRSAPVAATWPDVLVLALAALLFGLVCFLGQAIGAGLVLTLMIVGLALRGHDAEFRSGLIVLAAMAVNNFWGPLLFQTFTDQIIGIDVAALRVINAVLRPDISATGAVFRGGDGFAIIVIGACSVFNSASVAVLATTAMLQRLRPGLAWRDFAAIAMVLAVMLVLNTFRLALLGWSRTNYDYWHGGLGVVWFSVLETLVIAFVAWRSALWAKRA